MVTKNLSAVPDHDNLHEFVSWYREFFTEVLELPLNAAGWIDAAALDLLTLLLLGTVVYWFRR